MSRSGKVEFDWADGHHIFRLGIAELEELQERTGAGPFEVLRRLSNGSWRVAEVREPLRIGLIGGGMVAAAALKLVDRYVGPGQIIDGIVPAMTVINAALNGAPDEPVGGNASAVEEAGATVSPKAGSPSPRSTEPAQ